MKYAVSGRQPKSLLKQVDEIKMMYQDREKLIDYVEELNDKTFILEIPKEIMSESIEWDLYKAYSEKVNFILCINNLQLAKECKEKGIKFYWAYPVFSWYEFQGLIALEPCYITLGAPLSFNLEKVKKKTNIPLRLCPNLAYDAYIPRENGLYGTWVRPEDIPTYEKYIDVCDFVTDELSKEAVLLHTYKENKAWPGNLYLLLTNFNIHVDNRALPDELGEMRANCGQRCMENGTCHFCETAIKFATAIRHKHYEDNKIDLVDPIEEN